SSLEKLGFKVKISENCNQKTMKKAIDNFGKTAKKYDVALFFYAGHGVQVSGNNYLVPIDAKLHNEEVVEYDCVRAERILAKMKNAGTKINIVILDACRDNPFELSWNRGTKGSGLASMNAPVGSIIAYATSPGETASDGKGKNGLYTSALLKHLETPDITIEEMFKRVRVTALSISNNKQLTWESTSLRGNFYFKIRDLYNSKIEPINEIDVDSKECKILRCIPKQVFVRESEGVIATGKAISEPFSGKPSNRFTVQDVRDEKLIIDKATNLMWQATSINTRMTWAGSKIYVNKLRYANYTDWRLPTLEELGSLIEKKRDKKGHFIFAEFIIRGSRCWSSDWGENSNDVWYIDFSLPMAATMPDYREYSILAVRQNQ
ncbi:caspase family protein, partial [Desulfobacterales bacterium HSG17]|nr:caspase family protein [Desulfobacterales bacterium HSG17]